MYASGSPNDRQNTDIGFQFLVVSGLGYECQQHVTGVLDHADLQKIGVVLACVVHRSPLHKGDVESWEWMHDCYASKIRFISVIITSC